MNLAQIEKKLSHYMGKAIADYNMIQTGDRVLVCLSGGKDSYTMLTILNQLRIRSRNKFTLFSLTLDQGQPGWEDSGLRAWLKEGGYAHEILHRNTYSIVLDKVEEGKTYCSLCSRLRRGIIYRYARENGFTKIALGHHRDDLIVKSADGNFVQRRNSFYAAEIVDQRQTPHCDSAHGVLPRARHYCLRSQETVSDYSVQLMWLAVEYDA